MTNETARYDYNTSEDDERDSAAKYSHNTSEGDERDSAAKYDSNVNTVKSTKRDLPAKYDESDDSWKNTTDPDFEQVIIGLLDREKLFCNPFQLSRHVQEMLAAQASQAAARAITWSMVDFERVGGNGTLRTVWNALKDENRVKGLKRPHSEGDAEENKEEKQMCCSLDLSGTCHRLQLIDIVSEGSSCSGERG